MSLKKYIVPFWASSMVCKIKGHDWAEAKSEYWLDENTGCWEESHYCKNCLITSNKPYLGGLRRLLTFVRTCVQNVTRKDGYK